MKKTGAMLGALLIALSSALPATAARVKTRRVAPGISVKTITRRRPHQKIFVASVKLSKPSTVRTVLATGELPGLAHTSSIARKREALVAINGDYARPSGRPVMTFAQAGRLLQTELTYGRNFAVSGDEQHTYIGHPKVKIFFEKDTGETIEASKVNAGQPGPWNIGVFNSAGGALERPPKRSCSARLMADSLPRLGPEGAGVVTPYTVETVRCSYKPLLTRGGVVLSTPKDGNRTRAIKSLQRGQRLTMGWTLGWPGATETVGGNPTLVEDGRIVVEHSSHPFFRRNPRTGVGVTSDRRMLLVAVDGRRRKYSVGMGLREFAKFFRRQGAKWALNLDGGGSTTMVVRGRVINRPSDGPERPVSSALVVVPRNARRRTLARTGLTPSGPGPSTEEVWDEIAEDPASTGGLAGALKADGGRLQPALRNAARAFSRR